MTADPDAIRERATVEHRPPLHDLEADPMWIAEDPETGCAGVGDVEAEAVGNLVAVVVAYEAGDDDTPKLKVPGQVLDRPSETEGSLLDRLGGLF